MDPFLFASVGEEIAGIPLSVLSALAQLDLDPRKRSGSIVQYAARSSSQPTRTFVCPIARPPLDVLGDSNDSRAASSSYCPPRRQAAKKSIRLQAPFAGKPAPLRQAICSIWPWRSRGLSLPNSAGLHRLGQSRPCLAGTAGQLFVPAQHNALSDKAHEANPSRSEPLLPNRFS
jgi:hypothetical protein